MFCLVLPGFSYAITTISTEIKADKVLVVKTKRLMLLLRDGEVIKTYRISLGKNPNGHKTRSGDKKTPEGTYVLDYRKMSDKFHRSIHISYPNGEDLHKAQQNGLTPGGAIMIHGFPIDLTELENINKYVDWTDGCIAVTNGEIDEIWELVPDNTPIEIRP
jgi:murein L,D-transpeptidase YafK